ncbi:MAG: hypothetical protein A2033_14380 [Bacteroidetes bacterium GWA2_31_9]|nr:MAG: hypothetical protein A2033_14380 [Bacteroidetes bacterium GWA2_31_9]
MKLLLLIFLLFIISASLFSQEIILDSTATQKINKKVLVIPFSPRLYYNDADKDIAKQTGKTFEQIMNAFRIGYDFSLIKSLNDTCSAISILSGYTISNNEDIEDIYSNSIYVFEKAMGFDKKKPNGYVHSQLMMSDKKAEKDLKKAKKHNGGEVVSPVKDVTNKFMHVKFISPSYLIELSKKYEADYVLFINQFEIIGNYLNPYETGNNTNNMLIKVHYSLYSSTGKYLFGSFASSEYPSILTDINKISLNYFHLVNNQIIKNIPLEPEKKRLKLK